MKVKLKKYFAGVLVLTAAFLNGLVWTKPVSAVSFEDNKISNKEAMLIKSDDFKGVFNVKPVAIERQMVLRQNCTTNPDY